MISAKDLRDKKLLNLDKIMSDIEDALITANDDGCNSKIIDVDRRWPIDEVIAVLRKSGYTVRRSYGSDFRGDFWDYLTINW